MSTPSFSIDDPDAEITYPVTDTEDPGGIVDWPNPTVTAGESEISAAWTTPAANTRDLTIPLDSLPAGLFPLWLQVPGSEDIYLGDVEMVDPTATTPVASTECLWPVDPHCLGEEWDTYPVAVQVRARRLASSALTRLTAQRVTTCPITVRPVPSRNACFLPINDGHSFTLTGAAYPVPSGEWMNCLPCVNSMGPCSIRLPGPVGRVDEVKIDGVAIPPTDYRVWGEEIIWMGSGDCPFPAAQDLAKPDTEEGTFSVTYLNGYPVDALGAQAAGTMALEFARACQQGGKKCRLPVGVKTIARQGLTMEIPNGAFPDGRTGINEVDNYVALWNPHNRTHAPQVWSPDLPKVY